MRVQLEICVCVCMNDRNQANKEQSNEIDSNNERIVHIYIETN